MDRETLVESLIEIAEQGSHEKDAYGFLSEELNNTTYYSPNEVNEIIASLAKIAKHSVSRENVELLVKLLFQSPIQVKAMIVENGDLVETLLRI